MQIHYARGLIAAAVLTAAATIAPLPATADSGPRAAGEPAGNDSVVVETFTIDGKLTSVEAFNAAGVHIAVPSDFTSRGAVRASGRVGTLQPAPGGREIVPLGSGSGGTPSASGCRTVTVNNEKESTFGFTLYWYHTYTSWCWNRANKTTSNVSTGWYLSGVDPIWSYQSTIIHQQYHYAWISGYNSSGYYHERQAHMQSCQAGWCQNGYPRNQLFSHSDGTYNWATYN